MPVEALQLAGSGAAVFCVHHHLQLLQDDEAVCELIGAGLDVIALHGRDGAVQIACQGVQ